jgi:hypothetical protein
VTRTGVRSESGEGSESEATSMRVHSLKTYVSEEKFPLLAGALNSGQDITVYPQAFPELSITEKENVIDHHATPSNHQLLPANTLSCKTSTVPPRVL